MSSIDIDRLATQFDMSMAIKGKPQNVTPRSTFNLIKKGISGKKKSQTKRYFKRQMLEDKQEKKEQRLKEMLKRRKEVKVRYDTRRIASMSTAPDEIQNDLHYANFLGDKYGDNNAPYNSNTYVNLKFCDAMREDEEAIEVQSLDSMDSMDSWARKIRRMNRRSFDGCRECLNVDCACDPNRCLCEGCIYLRECNDRDCYVRDDMSMLSLGSGEDYDAVEDNLEWVERLVKRQHASYLQAIEDEEAGIEWEEEDCEPPLKRARVDDETFNV